MRGVYSDENYTLCGVIVSTTIRRLGALLAVLALAPLARLVCQTGEVPDHIGGVVLNRVTHEPVSRALVTSPDHRFAAFTDSQGRFEFKLPALSQNGQQTAAPSIYALSAKRPGFLQKPQDLVNITPENIGHDIVIYLEPESRIIGRVNLQSGEPPASVQVELFRREIREGVAHWIQIQAVATRHDGEFRFADLAAGDYKVLTSEVLDRDPIDFDPSGKLYGYPPVYAPNASDFFSASTFTLTAGETTQTSIILTRRPYYQVKIPVANAPPGNGFGIVVAVQGHKGPGYSLGYSLSSQTVEGTLPDGNYTVDAFSYGQNPSTGSTTLAVRGGPANGGHMTTVPNSVIPVVVKEEFSNQDVHTRERIIVRNGRPAGPHGYLNVFLEPADDFGLDRGATLRSPSGPNDDSLAVDNVSPGRYWVHVNSSRGYAASVTSGSLNLKNQPLVVGYGNTTSPIEITMRDQTAELDGSVDLQSSATQSSGPEGAHVYLIPLPDGNGDFRDGYVSPDGKFQLPDLPPGAYLVVAFDHAKSDLEYRNPDAMRQYESKGVVLRLTPGQKEQVHVHALGSNE